MARDRTDALAEQLTPWSGTALYAGGDDRCNRFNCPPNCSAETVLLITNGGCNTFSNKVCLNSGQWGNS